MTAVVAHPEGGASPARSRDLLAVDTIRALAMDAVERAKSGHPGAPLGLAPVAYLLWTRLLRHNPANPGWFDRDRFVLSCGHASMLQYALLHLSGYDLPIEELRRFRQFGSRCAGHPERGVTPGVEVTTGPLGQGLGNAVGMAIAERSLAHRFNQPGHEVVDHRTWVFCSDGDLMEGVASEAASLAGHLRLGKLKVVYDDNQITIEGSTSLAFSEDVGLRFEAYGWHVLRVDDGNDLEAIAAALAAAAHECERPSLILLRTRIGYPSPGKQGTAEAHGAPLGSREVAATKQVMGWPESPEFLVPEPVRRQFAARRDVGAGLERAWEARVAAFAAQHPSKAAEFARVMEGRLPDGWADDLPVFPPDNQGMATRQASGRALNALAVRVPELIGGSADLAPSTDTLLANGGDFSAGFAGRNLRFGVREHAMGACLNGMAAHGGVRPFGATFFVFTDYLRPALRMAALMELPVIYVMTHDSIGLGEDGPTHQPIEHLASLRAMPNVLVLRPGDANETVEAWRLAIENRHGPTVLVLTRQKVPVLDRAAHGPASGLRRGGYVVAEAAGATPRAILIATGSELGLAVEAWGRLAAAGVPVRVVSLPSWEQFEAQQQEYRDEVLPPAVRARLVIEAGASQGWLRYVTEDGDMMTIDRFGASAPADVLFREFGLTVEEAVRRVHRLLHGRTS